MHCKTISRVAVVSSLVASLAVSCSSERPNAAQRVSNTTAHHTEHQLKTEQPPAVIIPPIKDAPLSKLLIVFPGAQKDTRDYENLAHEIQMKSPFRIWVGIVRFFAGTAKPPQAELATEYIFRTLRKNGFADASPESTSIAGHSLGGIVAQYFVNQKNFQSLILLSSYLVRSDGNSSLPQADLPVFTLSGELDGQTRMTRVALDAKSLLDPANPVRNPEQKPVILLPKINHSQFAGTDRHRSDLPSEVEYSEAQRTIAGMISDFVLSSDSSTFAAEEKKSAKGNLSNAIAATRSMLSAYWAAQQKDREWCVDVQRSKALFLSDVLTTEINQTIYERTFDFALSKPSATMLSENFVGISIGSMLYYHPNVMDRSTIPEAAQSIACKNKSPESLAKLTGMPNSFTPSCSEHNKAAYAWALQNVSAEARGRFLKRGRQLRFAEDRRLASGVQWIAARLKFENDAEQRIATVTSPALLTGLNAPAGLDGMHYCKLLAPSRAIEWILVDGLRD